jgi:predicted TIM-barrel fold metal-dependent hydrolase
LLREARRISVVNTSRREFLGASGSALIGLGIDRGGQSADPSAAEPIIDIHQHVGYSGRPDAVLLAHQRALGVRTTILLPAGRPADRPSTHKGLANGLQAQARGNEACHQFSGAYPGEFLAGANDVPDLEGAVAQIEHYLKRGAVVIGEQKFGVECDAPEMQRIYDLARAHDVPVLMHWQHGMYNYGFERFHRMLEKYPTVRFVGHAQTWWANIDREHRDQSVLYPDGPVTPGGLTDRYLGDYPNMFGDLSAGSGLNALTRDEAFTRDFLTRHQDKLIFGSDCSDHDATGVKCLGSRTLAVIRRLAASREIERKLLFENAKRVFSIQRRREHMAGCAPDRGEPFAALHALADNGL